MGQSLVHDCFAADISTRAVTQKLDPDQMSERSMRARKATDKTHKQSLSLFASSVWPRLDDSSVFVT